MDTRGYPNVHVRVLYDNTLTLSQFKAVCPPMALWNIGRKISAICRFPDQITHNDVCLLSSEIEIPVEYAQFAVDLLLLGMSEVLGLYRERLYYGPSSVFSCFHNPVTRLELESYFATQMIEFREQLRFKFQYVDILLASAIKSPVTRKVLTNCNGLEKSKEIMLFCGLSVYTLLMACDPRTILGTESEQKKIYMLQLEWRMKHCDADESLFLHRGHKSRAGHSDVWDRVGPDSMETIERLQLAIASYSGYAAACNGLLVFE